MGRRRTTEREFQRLAQEAGFSVMPPHSIRVKEPVQDKHGKQTKIVTTPDFFVVDPLTNNGVHVEVTDGAGNTPHKSAQQRVIESAGVTNYVVITGDQIAAVNDLSTIVEKRELFQHYLFYMFILSSYVT